MLAPPSSSTSWRVGFIPNLSLSSSSPRWCHDSSPSSSSFCCSCSSSSTSSVEPLKAVVKPNLSSNPIPNPNSPPSSPLEAPKPNSSNDDESYTTKIISRVQVSRQKYIPVSKSRLLEALVSTLRSQLHSSGRDDADSAISHFVLLSSCLDSILHAEHKSLLEEMRGDYFSTLSLRDEEDVATSGGEGEREVHLAEVEEDGGVEGKVNAVDDTMEWKENQLAFLNGLDFFQLWGSSNDDFLSSVDQQSRPQLQVT